jgi:hypothetical protein
MQSVTPLQTPATTIGTCASVHGISILRRQGLVTRILGAIPHTDLKGSMLHAWGRLPEYQVAQKGIFWSQWRFIGAKDNSLTESDQI